MAERPPPRMLHPVLEAGPNRQLKRSRSQLLSNTTNTTVATNSAARPYNFHSPSPAVPGPSRNLPPPLQVPNFASHHHHHHHHHHHLHQQLHLPLQSPSRSIIAPVPSVFPNRAVNNQGFMPMAPGPQAQVIDLTGSSPPARGGQRTPLGQAHNPEVIDVDALPDPPQFPRRQSSLQSNEDVEMLFAREAAAARRPRFMGRSIAPPQPPLPRPIDPFFPGNQHFQPRLNQNNMEDPILGNGERIRQVPNNRPGFYGSFEGFAGSANRLMEYLLHQPHRIPQPSPHGRLHPGPHPRPHNGPHNVHGFPRNLPFNPPVGLDYGAQAPGILRQPSPQVDAAALRNADYTAPPDAHEGFTRSPKEEDVLVCVDCDQELGADAEEPGGDEVWAARCGHCYCGHCAMSYRIQKPSSGKRARTKRRICSVAGCTVNLATKANMVKIHL